jgi:hypothetical protein
MVPVEKRQPLEVNNPLTIVIVTNMARFYLQKYEFLSKYGFQPQQYEKLALGKEYSSLSLHVHLLESYFILR